MMDLSLIALIIFVHMDSIWNNDRGSFSLGDGFQSLNRMVVYDGFLIKQSIIIVIK